MTEFDEDSASPQIRITRQQATSRHVDDLLQRQRDSLAQRPPLEADVADIRRQLESLPEERLASPLAELSMTCTVYVSLMSPSASPS